MAKDYPYKSSSTRATEEDPDICIQDDFLWGVIKYLLYTIYNWHQTILLIKSITVSFCDMGNIVV